MKGGNRQYPAGMAIHYPLSGLIMDETVEEHALAHLYAQQDAILHGQLYFISLLLISIK